MLAIFKREMRSYFTDPLGYVYIAIFIFIANMDFYLTNLSSYQSDISPIFLDMIMFLVVLIPLMTMRLWSEEKKQKTEQLLLTAPVSTTSIVLGKFFAALTLFLIGLGLTLIFPVLIGWKGTLALTSVIGNYIGVILVAATYISISFFISSLTKSQIISVICSLLILAVFLFMDLLIGVSQSEVVNAVLAFLSMVTRYRTLYMGIFSLSDIFYFISISAIFLFLTSRTIEKQRWS